MPLIAGLGNIGGKYEGTRHNVGFQIIDQLADSLDVTLGPGRGPFYIGETSHRGNSFILLKPTTYMNNSGIAIGKALNQFNLEPQECLVCYDDLNLPMGKLRLRPGGSAGGHNGVSNIIYQLKTENFPRLRFGIGDNYHSGNQVQYVLSTFSEDQLDIVHKGLDEACDAIFCFIRDGIEKAMNQYN
jgi:PTH1 family peptidyl-tRNA hydrolase